VLNITWARGQAGLSGIPSDDFALKVLKLVYLLVLIFYIFIGKGVVGKKPGKL